jgi:hypothetical protein
MNLVFVLCWFLLPASLVFGQMATAWTYGGTATDNGYGLAKLSNAEFVIVGATFSTDGAFQNGADHLELIRALETGGSLKFEDEIVRVSTDYNGNEHADVSANAFVIRVDTNGKVLWSRTLSGRHNESFQDVCVTHKGEIVAAGWSESFDGVLRQQHKGSWDATLAKLDKNGNLKWLRYYGGSHDDEAVAVFESPDHGYLIAGETYSNDGDFADTASHTSRRDRVNRVFLIKTDSDGNVQWRRVYKGDSGHELGAISKTSDGGFIMSGHAYRGGIGDAFMKHNLGGFDVWIAKITTNGEVTWSTTYGGSGYDKPSSIIETADGGFAVLCEVEKMNGDFETEVNDSVEDHGGVCVIKTDSKGKSEWICRLNPGNSPDAVGLSSLPDSSIVVVLCAESNAKTASDSVSRDIFLSRINTKGKQVSELVLGGRGGDIPKRIAIDSNWVYVVGWTWSTDGCFPSTERNGEDAFLLRTSVRDLEERPKGR